MSKQKSADELLVALWEQRLVDEGLGVITDSTASPSESIKASFWSHKSYWDAAASITHSGVFKTDLERDVWYRHAINGESDRQIAQTLTISRNKVAMTLQNIRVANGLPRTTKTVSRTAPETVAEVVRLRERENLTFEEIAERMGYKAKASVHRIYRNAK